MILGRVIGKLQANKRHDCVVGVKLVVIRHVDINKKERDDFIIAADILGTKPGDLVLVDNGSRMEQQTSEANLQVDAFISAIVDNIELAPKKQQK